MNRRLITAALPYVNNVPHLGNLIQVLSADVFSRFCRSRGYETIYVGGTDEYGTATETRAAEEGKTPKELCDYYHKIHKDIYEWFGINFDYFGRTSDPQQTEIVQEMFLDLDKRGFISEHTIEQLYCPDCKRFLADRYVHGICPHCDSPNARGDQCEDCGKLLEPTELKNPHCATCGHTPELKSTNHLYINLPAIQKEYQKWVTEASEKGKWAKNALQITKAWIRDGLHERAITRDLKWGIPVPKKGYENKVFYVWFDAPIGYISITKALGENLSKTSSNATLDWKEWWLPTAEQKKVDLFQFIGKDNIPFHTVIFPSTLIGSGKNWTKLYHMSSSEYLNYESGKFSKSKGTGVFGNDAQESGIPADIWRFYIFYNRPEKSDIQFTWKDFQEKINSQLVGNLANLVNRTCTFVVRYYDGIIPEGIPDSNLWDEVKQSEQKISEFLEWANLKDALHEVFALSSIANKAFQDGEPWKTRTTDPKRAATLIRDLCYIIKDLMIVIHPFLPQYAEQVLAFFGKTGCTKKIGVTQSQDALTWNDLGKTEGLSKIENTKIIFTPMDNATTQAFSKKFSGAQNIEKEVKINVQNEDTEKKEKLLTADELETIFNKNIALKVAKIIEIEKHPDADKLYIEKLDDGSGTERIILSGLVPYLREDELLGKHVIIADNLKPRKMRGIESRGMLLAADYKDSAGNEKVEVLECPQAAPGTPVVLEHADVNAQKPSEINADCFFSVPIFIKNNIAMVGNKKLLVNDTVITTTHTSNGDVR